MILTREERLGLVIKRKDKEIARLRKQGPSVTREDVNRIAIELQAEMGSMMLSTVAAYKAVRGTVEKLGLEVKDDTPND